MVVPGDNYNIGDPMLIEAIFSAFNHTISITETMPYDCFNLYVYDSCDIYNEYYQYISRLNYKTNIVKNKCTKTNLRNNIIPNRRMMFFNKKIYVKNKRRTR